MPVVLMAQQLPVNLEVNKNKFNDVTLNVTKGVSDITTTGKDGYIFTNGLEVAIEDNNTVFSFEYFCPTGVDFIELYFYPLSESFAPKRINDVGSTEGWIEFKIDIADELKNWGKKGDFLRIDFGNAPDLKIQIQNLKIRAYTEREKELAAKKALVKKQEKILEQNLRDYLKADESSQINHVFVRHDDVVISGSSSSKNLFLAEVGIYEHITELKNFEFVIPIEVTNSKFEITIDRFVKRHKFTQDRLLSKWVLVEKNNNGYKRVSNARYQDSVIPKYTYPFVKPSTIKGLGGYSANREAPPSDLDDLGITSATVNIWINGLFRSTREKDNIPFEYLGKTYYIHKKTIEGYDKTFLSTAKKDIEVSAILLIAKASQSPDKKIGNILQHPDCDPAGIYSMPNVTTPEGVQYYAAILDFLANRYSRPDKKYGRIHHWIIHNEVDAGWVWTNAGEKEALVFMDLYHKSMRMSYNIARKYNPNSKVFISLTHYWNWTSNKHFYHSKELLEQLIDFSNAEGDFEWAIAQHPYPESLREPKTWLDEKVSFDFNTKLITFKNTEVLDAWVKQPEALYKGKYKRTVYLSENGTNSPTYSEQDLKEQAAGMAYAMKKIKYLDGIDGFQYHNWQDNRKEGGLRIGLRRFPDDEEKPGATKPVWYVYQAFGTDKEAAVFDQYKEMIGIKDWDEIRHKEPIMAQKKKVYKSLNIDNWVVTDALGRTLPNYELSGSKKENKYVGMFYFITHSNPNTEGPYNVNEILNNNPENPKWKDGNYYWGEPEIGYYLNQEPWAIKKHAYQLVDAGVDVIILDVTNNNTHRIAYLAICKVFQEMRDMGEKTPDITFLASEISVNTLWDEFYSKRLYEDLWFQWKGKPLLLYGQHEMPERNKVNDIKFSDEIHSFFSLKQSWAWTTLPWYDKKGQDEWPWVDHYPQAVSWHSNPNEKEMVPVAVAQHPLSNIGRSFHDFHQPETNKYDLTKDTDKGLFFQEQWNRALEIDPDFVFVTGWNEWSAHSQKMGSNINKELQKWSFYPGAHLGKAGKPIQEGDTYFIDQYNQEYSRDIEPMKGGHADNYYYQLMANIRRFKGMDKPLVSQTLKTISISGSFEQWNSIENVFYDHVGDTEHRHSEKQGSAGPYINTNGRNDIELCKVSRDNDTVFFYVKTRNKLTPSSDANWMLLLIDSDQNKETGWESYDIIVNQNMIDAEKTIIKKYDRKKGWVQIQETTYNVKGDELMLSVPIKFFNQNETLNFDFHWVDNPTQLETIYDLFEAGDNAPSRRANYRFLE
jgi:hypothetical protein